MSTAALLLALQRSLSHTLGWYIYLVEELSSGVQEVLPADTSKHPGSAAAKHLHLVTEV